MVEERLVYVLAGGQKLEALRSSPFFFSPPLLTVASIRFYRINMGSPPKKPAPAL
jgi:hypothetical protein